MRGLESLKCDRGLKVYLLLPVVDGLITILWAPKSNWEVLRNMYWAILLVLFQAVSNVVALFKLNHHASGVFLIFCAHLFKNPEVFFLRIQSTGQLFEPFVLDFLKT